MKNYDSIPLKNSAIDRLTVETTKPGKTIGSTPPVQVSPAEFHKKQEEKKQEEKKKEAQRLARRKG